MNKIIKKSTIPLISIITITYNDKEGLESTFKSVFNQTWKEFEYVVIDGGSTDGSVDVIKDFEKEIDYWISEPDKGIYNAMNKGIKVANGEYLLFLNSGDCFYDYSVLKENNKFIKNKDFIYFNLFVASMFPYVNNYPEHITFLFFFQKTLSQQSTFIKRDLFEKIGYYDENLWIQSDWKFFMLAIIKYNCSYKKVNTILSVFNSGGISSKRENQEIIRKEKRTVLEKEFKHFVQDYDMYSEYIMKIDALRNSKKMKLILRLGLFNKF